jgi:dipeptidyl aminopeptidase/acylaminoacyl peptidase
LRFSFISSFYCFLNTLIFEPIHPSFHLVSLPDGNTVRRFYGVDKWVEDIIPSPDHTLGIFQGADVRFPRTGHIIQLWDGRVRGFSFEQALREPNVWSPDSAYLTVGIDNTCRCDRNNFITDLGVVDVGSGELRQLTTGEKLLQDNRAVSWSPDGAALVYVTHTQNPVTDRASIVKLVFVSGGEPITLFRRDGDVSIYVRWLPDGQHIALSSLGREAEIWFVDAQTAQVTFHYTAAENIETCWSPKTNHFIAVSEIHFTLITPDGSPPLDTSFVDPSIWMQNTVYYDACAWSPDAKKLVLVQRNPSSPPIAHIIDFEKRTVSDIRVNHPAPFLIPYWSPDSRLLALKTYRPLLASGDTYIYDTSTTIEQIYYQTHANFLSWLPELH